MSMSRSWLETNGWPQGSLVSSEDLDLLKEHFVQIPRKAEFLITASQSCDVCAKIEKERFIEFSVASSIDKPHGLNLYNKNPRCLHLTADQDSGNAGSIDGAEIHLELFAGDKISLDKSEIEKIKSINPSKLITLNSKTVSQYADWLAARYNRPALPSAFEIRFNNSEGWKKDPRVKATGKLSEHILGIYVDITPDNEIPDTEPYEVDILVLIKQKAFDNTDIYQKIEILINKYVEAMIAANFIIGDVDITTESQVSLALFRSYKRIILENLSYKQNDCLPILNV